MFEFDEMYGQDRYAGKVPFNGYPIEIVKNGINCRWMEVPYAIRCWIFSSLDANRRFVEAHPFPQPPIVEYDVDGALAARSDILGTNF